MAMTEATTAGAWLPTEFGAMLVKVVQANSVAAQASTVFPTNRERVNFPLWVADPAVGWYSELDTIAETDGTTGEVVVIPAKTAGLVLAGNETVEDSDPDIAAQIAAGLANQIAKAVDSAFLANTTAKGPNGLLSLAYTSVDTGAALTNLDSFVAGRYAAEANGAKLSHWIVSPATAEALSKLKTASGSNQPLLEFVEDGITVAGLPVLTSTFVDAATFAWGLDKTQQRFVLRSGTTVERFPAVSTDGTWVRAISRIGLGYLNPAGVVRLWDAP